MNYAFAGQIVLTLVVLAVLWQFRPVKRPRTPSKQPETDSTQLTSTGASALVEMYTDLQLHKSRLMALENRVEELNEATTTRFAATNTRIQRMRSPGNGSRRPSDSDGDMDPDEQLAAATLAALTGDPRQMSFHEEAPQPAPAAAPAPGGPAGFSVRTLVPTSADRFGRGR